MNLRSNYEVKTLDATLFRLAHPDWTEQGWLPQELRPLFENQVGALEDVKVADIHHDYNINCVSCLIMKIFLSEG